MHLIIHQNATWLILNTLKGQQYNRRYPVSVLYIVACKYHKSLMHGVNNIRLYLAVGWSLWDSSQRKHFLNPDFLFFSWSKEKSWSISITDCLNLINCLYRKWRTNSFLLLFFQQDFPPGIPPTAHPPVLPGWPAAGTCTQNRMHIPSSIKGLGETCFDTLIIWKSPSVCTCEKAAIHALVSPSCLLNCDSVWQHCSSSWISPVSVSSISNNNQKKLPLMCHLWKCTQLSCSPIDSAAADIW